MAYEYSEFEYEPEPKPSGSRTGGRPENTGVGTIEPPPPNNGPLVPLEPSLLLPMLMVFLIGVAVVAVLWFVAVR
jgi:hypothetical protein